MVHILNLVVIFLLFFCLHGVKPLMPILALLSMLCVWENPTYGSLHAVYDLSLSTHLCRSAHPCWGRILVYRSRCWTRCGRGCRCAHRGPIIIYSPLQEPPSVCRTYPCLQEQVPNQVWPGVQMCSQSPLLNLQSRSYSWFYRDRKYQ